MDFRIGNYTLLKGENSDDKFVKVKIVANRLTRDSQAEQILPEAFDKETVKNFIDNGVIDWWHKSITGNGGEEQARSLLGRPYDFKWEDGVPVVYANLTKGHPIVQEMLPHLDADMPVYGGSVGGAIKGFKNILNKSSRESTKKVFKIMWNHLAIAPTPYTVNQGCQVSMVKALSPGIDYLDFSDVSTFENGFDYIESNEEIMKAIQMGAGTDIAGYTGGDALRTESLEGSPVSRMFSDEIIEIMVKANVRNNDDVISFLKGKGYSDPQVQGFMNIYRDKINNLRRE